MCSSDLDRRNNLGVRLLPDGRTATIVIEHASEETEDTDAMSLIADQWKKIGIRLLAKPQSINNFRLRNTSGESLMVAYAGYTTAVPTAVTSPKEFAPTMQGGLQWPKWGLFFETGGKQGEKCDLPEAEQLLELVKNWEQASNDDVRRAAWTKIQIGRAHV